MKTPETYLLYKCTDLMKYQTYGILKCDIMWSDINLRMLGETSYILLQNGKVRLLILNSEDGGWGIPQVHRCVCIMYIYIYIHNTHTYICIHIHSKTFRTSVWRTQTNRAPSPGVKRPGREFNHSSASRVEVKNGWSLTFTSPVTS